MNTIAVTHRNAFKAPISVAARAACALAVAGFVATAWLSAGTESHRAVDMSTAALSRSYITLPTVVITAQREAQLAPVARSNAARANAAL